MWGLDAFYPSDPIEDKFKYVPHLVELAVPKASKLCEEVHPEVEKQVEAQEPHIGVRDTQL